MSKFPNWNISPSRFDAFNEYYSNFFLLFPFFSNTIWKPELLLSTSNSSPRIELLPRFWYVNLIIQLWNWNSLVSEFKILSPYHKNLEIICSLKVLHSKTSSLNLWLYSFIRINLRQIEVSVSTKYFVISINYKSMPRQFDGEIKIYSSFFFFGSFYFLQERMRSLSSVVLRSTVIRACTYLKMKW